MTLLLSLALSDTELLHHVLHLLNPSPASECFRHVWGVQATETAICGAWRTSVSSHCVGTAKWELRLPGVGGIKDSDLQPRGGDHEGGTSRADGLEQLTCVQSAHKASFQLRRMQKHRTPSGLEGGFVGTSAPREQPQLRCLRRCWRRSLETSWLVSFIAP
ncbi:hypothetical protein MHYP_G00220090 [Metynnis hypsauchen]